MRKYHDVVIVGKAYPVMCGLGWRCFDGKEWHDCDADGHIKKRGVKMDGGAEE